jgi:L-2,4-diaminobutyrate transaminase
MWKILEQGNDQYGPIGHGWTYSAHPISAAAGVANLQLIDDLNLIQNVKEVGPHFKSALIDAVGDHMNVGEVRGEGLMCAVELVSDKADRKFFEADQKIGYQVAAALLSHGVIARAMPQGDIIGFAPPFCISKAQAEEVAEKLAQSIKEVLG